VDAEGDGYVSPEFDLPSASESEYDDAPPQKRQRPSSRKTREDSDPRKSRPMALVDEEALALALLRGR
jgi:ATP-dependent RNA helicase DDX10/DBP4